MGSVMKRRSFIKNLLLLSASFKVGISLARGEKISPKVSGNTFLWDGEAVKGVDNRVSLQSEIDRLSTLYTKTGDIQKLVIQNGVYELSAIDFIHSISGRKYGKCCIVLKSGVHLIGNGVLKLMDRQYGENDFFRMIASQRQSDRLKDVAIDGISFDGNAKNNSKSKQASNVLLECDSDILIANVKSFDSNGMGIMVRGDKNDAAKNIIIKKCKVSNCKNIGIQVTHFNGLDIFDNVISNCDDNGIDIYGDNGDGHALPTGRNFSIHGNKVSNCLTGIFPETVSDGVIFGNEINDPASAGIQVNRIHNEPQNIKIYANIVSGGLYSIRFNGDMKNIMVYKNEFYSARKASIMFGNKTNANVSSILVEKNSIAPLNDSVDIVFLGGNTMSNIVVRDNIIPSHLSANGQSLVNNKAKKSWRLDVGNWIINNEK